MLAIRWNSVNPRYRVILLVALVVAILATALVVGVLAVAAVSLVAGAGVGALFTVSVGGHT